MRTCGPQLVRSSPSRLDVLAFEQGRRSSGDGQSRQSAIISRFFEANRFGVSNLRPSALATPICFIVLAVAAAADFGTLSVRVVDSEGAVIEAAHVLVHADRSGRQGRFEWWTKREAPIVQVVSRLKWSRDSNDLCVMADAFAPMCQKIRVMAQSPTNMTVRLKIDPKVIREISDTFPRGR